MNNNEHNSSAKEGSDFPSSGEQFPQDLTFQKEKKKRRKRKEEIKVQVHLKRMDKLG